MKKTALVLLIAMIVSLFGCSYIEGVFGGEDVYDDESADVENNESEDESGEVEIPSDDEKEEKLLANQQVIKTPVVRNGKLATVGYMPDVWKKWS